MDRGSLTVPDGADTYLETTQADFDAIKPEHMSSYVSADHILKEYKSLDCACCGSHFGYQHRKDPNIKLCSSNCLSVADLKIRNLGLFSKTGKSGYGFPHSPTVDVPRVVLSNIPSGGCLSTLCGVDIPVITSSLESQAKIAAAVSSQASSSRQVNGYHNGIDDENGYGTVPSYGSNKRFEHSNGGSDRGGRGGGFSSRGGGVSRGGTRSGGFDRNSSSQDLSRGGWQRSTDEIDAKLSPGKENEIPSADSAFKLLQLDRKEDLIRAAREGAKLTKPSVGFGSADMAPIPKPLSTLTKNYKADVEDQQQPKKPIPVRPAEITPVAPVEKVPVVRPTVSKATQPVVEPAPAPPPVKAPAQVPSPPVKKIWKIDDLILSGALVNQAECMFSFTWEPTKYTLTASADQENIYKLQQSIAEYCSAATALGRVPSVGDILFGPYDGEFYRGRVDRVTKDAVDLTFIDFGDHAVVKFSECKEPCDKLMRDHPMYGMIFNVNTKVPCPPDFRLSDAITKIVETGTVYLQTDSQQDLKSEWSGTLFVDAEGKTTMNSMLDELIAKSSPAPAPVAKVEVSKPAPTPAPVPAEKKKPDVAPTPSPSSSVSSPAPSSNPGTSRPVSAGGKSNPFRDGARPPVQTRKTIHNTPLTDNLDNGSQVRISFVWNDAKISINSQEDDQNLDILTEMINKHVETAPEMSRKPELNEIVIAPYGEYYYRGKVDAVIGDRVKVMFVDYGDQTECNYNELRELTADIAKTPIYGVIFRLDGVPDTSDITESAELATAVEETGQIEVLERQLGIWTGRLWVGNDRTWNDIVMSVRKEAGGWNPWGTDIFKEVGYKHKRENYEYDYDSDSSHEYPSMKHSNDNCDCQCEGFGNDCGHVSKLDKILIDRFGPEYLVQFAISCYPEYRKKLVMDMLHKKHEESMEEKEEIDMDEGAYVSHRVIEGHAESVDLNAEDNYDGTTAPPLPLRIGDNVNLRISKFRELHAFHAYPVDEPFSTYIKRLCALLKEYCENPQTKLKRLPKNGQLCFVKVPSWAAIDEMMMREKGRNWKQRVDRRTNKDDDGWMAGKWFRGIVVSGSCNPHPKWVPQVFEVMLLDVGRHVPVHKDDIRFAALRYALIPTLSVKGIFLLQSMTRTSDPVLPPKELKEKWYKLFPRGTVIPSTVLYQFRDSTVVTIPIEIEQKLDIRFQKKYPDQFQDGLEAIEKESESTKLEDKYLLPLNDLKSVVTIVYSDIVLPEG